MRLFFQTIPKPLKQYTFFKKDDPINSPSCGLTHKFYNKNALISKLIE
jgi:hypothetical protein